MDYQAGEETLDFLECEVIKVFQHLLSVLIVIKVTKVSLDQLEYLVFQDYQEQQVLRAYLDYLVQMDYQVRKVYLVLMVAVSLELWDFREQKVSLVFREILEQMA